MLLVEDVDIRNFLQDLIHAMWEELPEKRKNEA